jgi:hypothetical protein
MATQSSAAGYDEGNIKTAAFGLPHMLFRTCDVLPNKSRIPNVVASPAIPAERREMPRGPVNSDPPLPTSGLSDSRKQGESLRKQYLCRRYELWF